MWASRDKNGSLRLYIEKPVQKQKIKDSEYETCLDWCTDVDKMIGYLPSNLYPELKWGDEPVEVSIVPINILDDIRDSMLNRGMNNEDIQNISKGFLKRK